MIGMFVLSLILTDYYPPSMLVRLFFVMAMTGFLVSAVTLWRNRYNVISVYMAKIANDRASAKKAGTAVASV